MAAGMIDVHLHLIPQFYREAVYEAGTGPAIGRYPDWTPALALELMDKHWIALAMLSLGQPGVGFLPDDKAADSIVDMRLTCTRLPFRYAPQPRSAYASSPYTGALDTPSTISPPRISAIWVENMGYSRTKALVPSMGSTSQTLSACVSRLPVSSP